VIIQRFRSAYQITDKTRTKLLKSSQSRVSAAAVVTNTVNTNVAAGIVSKVTGSAAFDRISRLRGGFFLSH
jgi:hypothetical protein